jgi:O-antigen/teichoic acid export membrane protein
MGLLTNAFNAAWVPFLFGALKDEGEVAHPRLARLVTYYAFVLCFVGLGWALLVEHALPLLAGPQFQAAYRITPWVVGGYVLGGLYFIPTNLLFWRRQTRVIPLVTVAAGAANIGLNLWLVPRYGAIAAAWSTLVAYGLLLALTWWRAERLHPFPYEYRRLGLMAGLALALFMAGRLLPFPGPALEVAGRVLLWLSFPFGLLATGAVDRSELAVLTRLLRGGKRAPAEQPGPIH